MHMIHKDSDIELLISKYLSKEATLEEIKMLESWISASSENHKSFLVQKNIWEVGHPAFNPDEIDIESAHKKIMEQIHYKNRSASVRPISSFMHYWQQIAAILLLPLLILSTYLYFKPDSRIVESYQELFTPYGTWSVVNLPDGSKVWLNAGSSLKYPTLFNGKERIVSLQGEAYFEVESDSKHPFIVETGKLTVEATGTAFNVNAYAPDNIAAVTLVKGKVAVTLDKTKTVSLSPGEKIDYNQTTSLYNVHKTNTYKWCSWKDGILIFRDDPLEYVFKRLGQTYNVEFVLKDTELGKYTYKATFEGESLNEILRLLEMSAPIRCKEISNRSNNNRKFEKQRIEVSKTER